MDMFGVLYNKLDRVEQKLYRIIDHKNDSKQPTDEEIERIIDKVMKRETPLLFDLIKRTQG